ncbi:expressed unknown protein [Seminavis robusta]|uniref:Sulfotransferase n=1 Tax=Seminavis robusta TaxID=568900 RepID=A0A9N8DTL4_9STRA|nr:expressed unknown protein [Seminavis robusta]|eukprot:Sro268_g103570.1 n/a (428) ;mRNA; f:1363-2646
MMWRRVNAFLANRNNRFSVCMALVLMTGGTLIFRWSFPDQAKALFDPMQAELESVLAHDKLRANNKKAATPKKTYKLPPPISYFKHGNDGLDDASYCIHNSTSDYCCSEEHCATIVARSTLYSECCGNVHNNKTGSRSQIFPLLITSAPRGGTWFMQQLLTKTGLQGLTTDEHTPQHLGTVSWKHIFHQDKYYFGRQSTTHLYKSKFRVIWHLVRDPLKTLTSIAFTDPLWEDSDHSRIYMNYIASHIPISNKTVLMAQFNITKEELEGVMQHRTIAMNRNPKLSHFLIFRGLEIYLYWQGFINYLNVPIFRLEDLAVDKNVTILDEIFRSVGRDPPSHQRVIQVLEAQQIKRHEHQRRRELRRQLQLGAYKGNARGDRIRKGSRIHRATLTWEELCEVSEKKALSMLKMSQSFGYYLDVDRATLCN